MSSDEATSEFLSNLLCDATLVSQNDEHVLGKTKAARTFRLMRSVRRIHYTQGFGIQLVQARLLSFLLLKMLHVN